MEVIVSKTPFEKSPFSLAQAFTPGRMQQRMNLSNLLQEVSFVLAAAGLLHALKRKKPMNGLKECSCASFPRRERLG